MATVLDTSTNKIKLDNGSVVTANTGGWYDGQQYWGGTLSDKGVENSLSNSATAGKKVSSEVNAASAASQGVSVKQFDEYLGNLSVSNLQSPVSVPYTTNANGTYITGLNDEVAKARAALDQNISSQRTTVAGQLETAKGKESAALTEVQKLTTPFRADLEATQRETLGVNQVLTEQKGLLSELDQLLTEGNALIKQQKEVTGLSSIRNPRIQKTMDDVSARAGVINAVVSLQNTYLSNAYTSIDRTVNAITQDRQDQLGYYNTILNLANRDIISLTAADKSLAEQQTALLKSDLDRSQKTVDYIKDLMVNPSTAMAMAQSGVSLNDSVEVINTKLSQFAYTQEVKEVNNSMGKDGYVSVVDPKTVPANQLVTLTDSKGKKYYYRKAVTSSGGFDSANFFKQLQEIGFKVDGVKTDPTQPTIDTSSIWNEVLANDNTTYAGKPSFVPSGGVGTKWTDATGKAWVYGNSGWVTDSKNNVNTNLNLNLPVLGVGAN